MLARGLSEMAAAEVVQHAWEELRRDPTGLPPDVRFGADEAGRPDRSFLGRVRRGELPRLRVGRRLAVEDARYWALAAVVGGGDARALVEEATAEQLRVGATRAPEARTPRQESVGLCRDLTVLREYVWPEFTSHVVYNVVQSGALLDVYEAGFAIARQPRCCAHLHDRAMDAHVRQRGREPPSDAPIGADGAPVREWARLLNRIGDACVVNGAPVALPVRRLIARVFYDVATLVAADGASGDPYALARDVARLPGEARASPR